MTDNPINEAKKIFIQVASACVEQPAFELSTLVEQRPFATASFAAYQPFKRYCSFKRCSFAALLLQLILGNLVRPAKRRHLSGAGRRIVPTTRRVPLLIASRQDSVAR